MNDTADHEHIRTSARALMVNRQHHARSRERVRAVLDAMAAEARRYLGEVFTENDPVTNLAVALVVRSDERLPDDYEKQTPRPPADTLNRLIVEVLGRALTIEISDAGIVRASGDTADVALDGVSDVRVTDGATFLVFGDDDAKRTSDIPFIRALAALIDAATRDETRYTPPRTDQAAAPLERAGLANSEEPAIRGSSTAT